MLDQRRFERIHVVGNLIWCRRHESTAPHRGDLPNQIGNVSQRVALTPRPTLTSPRSAAMCTVAAASRSLPAGI